MNQFSVPDNLPGRFISYFVNENIFQEKLEIPIFLWSFFSHFREKPFTENELKRHFSLSEEELGQFLSFLTSNNWVNAFLVTSNYQEWHEESTSALETLPEELVEIESDEIVNSPEESVEIESDEIVNSPEESVEIESDEIVNPPEELVEINAEIDLSDSDYSIEVNIEDALIGETQTMSID